jgi:uncharacterized protein involved in tolerance to divalent cations
MHIIKIISPAGKKLAGSIISEKLAACVNIVPGRNYILSMFSFI